MSCPGVVFGATGLLVVTSVELLVVAVRRNRCSLAGLVGHPVTLIRASPEEVLSPPHT